MLEPLSCSINSWYISFLNLNDEFLLKKSIEVNAMLDFTAQIFWKVLFLLQAKKYLFENLIIKSNLFKKKGELFGISIQANFQKRRHILSILKRKWFIWIDFLNLMHLSFWYILIDFDNFSSIFL